MRTTAGRFSAVLMLFVLGLLHTGVSLAQTSTTVDVRKFEVISVDGNHLVVRDERGTNEYTVPDDFRFTVDGRKLAANEMKPGMKGTATVTTKTTIVPVTLTEFRDAVVVDATSHSVTIRGPEGTRRFTQSELDERGVQILKEGKIVRIRDLRKGDSLTATIISKGPPVVVTEKEIEATLAQAKPEAAPAPAAPAAPASADVAAPAPAPAAASMPEATTPPPAATSPPPAAPATATQPPMAEGTSSWIWYLVIAIVIVLGWLLFARKKKQN
jgi:LPXTG-motif cell wall-anchored protein